VEIINAVTNSGIIPPLLIIGIITIVGYYAGRNITRFKLPSIIGFMLLGVMLGPSLVGMLNDTIQEEFSFIPQIALGFVALAIGLELKLSALKNLGSGIIVVILAESFGAFFIVTTAVYCLTRDLPLSLIFGAMAPASAPAGTVAVIREYRAKGPLTKALYAVVGFDDGLAIIIFGFAAAVAKNILLKDAAVAGGIWQSLTPALHELVISVLVGIVLAVLFCVLTKKIEEPKDLLILIFGFVFLTTGFCIFLNLSVILTNMILGFTMVNTQKDFFIRKIHEQLGIFMPILFILFFVLSGANLHLAALPALGLLGVVYIIARTVGLMSGAYVGAVLGKLGENLRKYIGLGILSQAGVAIGLALIVKHDFSGLGQVIDTTNGVPVYSGDYIGVTVLTAITATCIFFELVGPLATKYALTKAGEISPEERS